MLNTNQNILFSIVLPTYGVEAYLADAIRDIQAQTYAQWELLIVDDASPDGSRAIAQHFADEDNRIKILTHEHNMGLSGARNTGFAAAQGCYIWIPDPDDRYEATLLESCLSAINQALSAQKMLPEAIIFGHSEEFYSAQGEWERQVAFPVEVADAADISVLGEEQLRKAVLPLEVATQYGYAWNKMYQRDYLRRLGLQYQTVPLIEDIQFNVAYFQNLESLAVIKRPLYHYAKREAANLTNKFVSRYYEVHHERIALLRNQLESWGLLNEKTKATLGGLFARYIISALERNREPESGMNATQRKQWLQDVFADPLFNELIPCARAQESTLLKVCLGPLQKKSVTQCLALGSVTYQAKHRMGSFFKRARAGR